MGREGNDGEEYGKESEAAGGAARRYRDLASYAPRSWDGWEASFSRTAGSFHCRYSTVFPVFLGRACVEHMISMIG